VQFRAALAALIPPLQRQSQLGERSAAFPADEIVAHTPTLVDWKKVA
jgi:hypothetical protein